MRTSTPGGYSLLEALLALLIASILLALAAPPMGRTLDRSQASKDVSQIYRSIQLARTHAITKKTVTTFCASSNGVSCGGPWREGTLLFRDNNDNRVVDHDDHVIEIGKALSHGTHLFWRASAGRNQYLRFAPTGVTKEFGRFSYCPNSEDISLRSMLILNRMGRIRKPLERNAQGVIEDRDGRQPECPG